MEGHSVTALIKIVILGVNTIRMMAILSQACLNLEQSKINTNTIKFYLSLDTCMLVVINSDLVLGGLVGVGGSDSSDDFILLLSIIPYTTNKK